MVVEYGILMLPVFIILVIKVYKKVLKNKKYSFALASFITMMIIAFFLSSYAFKFFWNVLMFMGLIIAMEKIESEVKVVG
jgi:tellurite resistance protein TehA-like permease